MGLRFMRKSLFCSSLQFDDEEAHERNEKEKTKEQLLLLSSFSGNSLGRRQTVRTLSQLRFFFQAVATKLCSKLINCRAMRFSANFEH